MNYDNRTEALMQLGADLSRMVTEIEQLKKDPS
jgi:hypothetical protein